ncbi:hypothetical protein MKX01_030904 [Papaver californicum]|nr:hypothetical protein MKX01_030904 [Papaver californicum]
MSKLRLKGKVAIITGAASGIGEATARLFVEHGAFVVVADIQDELGDQVVFSIGKEKASYKHCDVRIEKQVKETVAFALEKYGSLDIVYSNTGMGGSFSSILEFSLEDFNKTMATNVSGAAVMIKHASHRPNQSDNHSCNLPSEELHSQRHRIYHNLCQINDRILQGFSIHCHLQDRVFTPTSKIFGSWFMLTPLPQLNLYRLKVTIVDQGTYDQKLPSI